MTVEDDYSYKDSPEKPYITLNGQWWFDTMTDQTLKLKLAELLPNVIVNRGNTKRIYWTNTGGFAKNVGSPNYGAEVLDTELLHICWLIEHEFSRPEAIEYTKWLEQNIGGKDWHGFAIWHATWQQRAVAICKVKDL